MAGTQTVSGPPDVPGDGSAGVAPSLPSRADPAGWIQAAAAAQARAALLWLSRQRRMQRVMAEFGPARRMARRFVAGETRADALAAVAALRGTGLRTTVAFLGEHTTDPAEARAAADEYAQLLRELAAAGLDANCSLKLTQLGLQIDPAPAEEGLRAVLAVADEVDGFVRIDMESSDVVDATLDLFERVISQRGARSAERGVGMSAELNTSGLPAALGAPRSAFRVGVVIQAYLRRSEGDVRRLLARGAPVRLVKGAYAEPPEVAFPHKADVDAAFVRLARLLLAPEARAAGVYPAFATHDPALIAAVGRLARDYGVPADGYEFQMLLGVRRDLQGQIARAGLRLRIYVPYGEHWYPYFMRRLAERPANLFFLVRNLFRR